MSLIPIAPPTREPFGLTYITTASSTANATSYTFSSQSLGNPDQGRYIVIAASSRRNGSFTTISGVTVAGVTATAAVTIEYNGGVNNGTFNGLWIAAVPTGTTGDVVVSCGSNTHGAAAASIYRLVGVSSATPATTASDEEGVALSLNLNTTARSALIAVRGSADLTSANWVGITEQIDSAIQTGSINSNFAFSSGLFLTSAAETPRTVSVTSSGGNDRQGAVVAAWTAA